jgi:hypothetical protein
MKRYGTPAGSQQNPMMVHRWPPTGHPWVGQHHTSPGRNLCSVTTSTTVVVSAGQLVLPSGSQVVGGRLATIAVKQHQVVALLLGRQDIPTIRATVCFRHYTLGSRTIMSKVTSNAPSNTTLPRVIKQNWIPECTRQTQGVPTAGMHQRNAQWTRLAAAERIR